MTSNTHDNMGYLAAVAAAQSLFQGKENGEDGTQITADMVVCLIHTWYRSVLLIILEQSDKSNLACSAAARSHWNAFK